MKASKQLQLKASFKAKKIIEIWFHWAKKFVIVFILTIACYATSTWKNQAFCLFKKVKIILFLKPFLRPFKKEKGYHPFLSLFKIEHINLFGIFFTSYVVIHAIKKTQTWFLWTIFFPSRLLKPNINWKINWRVKTKRS